MKTYFGSIRPSVYWPIKIITRIVFSPFFDVLSSGIENLPNDYSFILMAKHQRWEDIPLLGIVLPKPLYYVAKYELFVNPISAWFISSLGGIPLNRARPMESRDAILSIIDCLKRGEGVVIFPEGTYYMGSMGRGKTGLLRMIQSRLSIPIVPVGIEYKRKGARTRARIKIGKPVHEDPEKMMNQFHELIMEEIARLSNLNYGE